MSSILGHLTNIGRKAAPAAILASVLLAGCSGAPKDSAEQDQVPALGIRPNGDTELKIDMSEIHSDELKRVFDYIDKNIDQHVVNLQRWVQQPSVSNTGEGIPESAEMVRGFFDELGCQKTQVYDVGMTDFGLRGNPVVYASCDEGAEKTLVVYWMYDTMPVTQPEAWVAPPFEGQLVKFGPYPKVMIGRGASNTKGPQMVQLNALHAIKAVAGKLPVNLIFVADGDEERMSIGYQKFVRENRHLFAKADAMWAIWGVGGSEGSVFVELTTSGKKWGRGPNVSDIHGGNKRSVDSPAWRHIKMLSTLVDETGNRVLIDGFYDNIEPLTKQEEAALRERAKSFNMKTNAERLGVERFIADDPYEHLKMARYGVAMNLDGIWGGNTFPGGAGAILPNKVTSKHNIRYVPNMSGPDLVAKLRKHLLKHGYGDVEVNVIGDVPWSKMTYNNDFAQSVFRMFKTFGAPRPEPIPHESILGGYWPAHLFAGEVLDIPIAGGSVGTGGNEHAANEYFVIEGSGSTYGMAGAEKSVVTALYNYGGWNSPGGDAARKAAAR